ncbi:MAG TPA: homogentisate phytyltransferase [Candidatus Obscuribacterales bacterium]
MSKSSTASHRPKAVHSSFLRSLWRFSRPHTILGTTLSLWGIGLIAGAIAFPAPLGWLFLSLVAAWITCLCGNVYIVGLNQLEDIPIDRINKPQLPLASGSFSRRQGQWIVAISGGVAIALAALQGPFLLAMVGLSLLIGTAYSLPPLRLKRFPFWASLCILGVRGVIVNLGLFLHSQAVLTQQSLWLWSTPGSIEPIPGIVWALTGFILVFTFAIAIFKDIPDVAGDRQYNILTLTARLGSRAVFNLSRWVITASYGGMILVGWGLDNVNRPWLIGTHLMAIALFWILSRRVNLHRPADIVRFYQTIWKFFFVEYLIVPIACGLALL